MKSPGRLFVAALVSTVCTVCGAAAFPTANPDDQVRFFWNAHGGMYAELREAGFNNIINPLGGKFEYDFEKGAGYEGPIDSYVRLSEQYARDGIDWTVQILPMFDRFLKKTYPRILRDGTKSCRAVDMTAPGCLERVQKMSDYYARRLKAFKCGIGLMPGTEERVFTCPTFAPHSLAAFKAATGMEVPPQAKIREAPSWRGLKDFPQDGIVDRDYPVLAYYRWFWQEGDGFEKSYKVQLDTFKRAFGDDLFSIYDPALRVPPIWGSGGEVTHIEQWKTADPYPYQASYLVSELNAMAEGQPGQGVMMLVQGFIDSDDIAPTNALPEKIPAWRARYPTARFITAPPDLFLEELWSSYSRKMDGIGTHAWDALWVNAADYNLWRSYYVFTNPETKALIKRVFNEVGVPLGPFFRQCPEPDPEVAVLEGYASAILSGRAPWDWMMPYRVWGFIAEGANLQPATLYEEKIARDGIPASLKVILAPETPVVTKETAAALRAFQARGGKIVADAQFVRGLKADALLPKIPSPVPFYRQREAEPRDAVWNAAAAELAKTVRAFAPARIRSSAPDILVRARRCGSADYVFAINDRRDFGDYIGPWKRMREKGLPNSGRVEVRRTTGAVYDLVRHQPVPFEERQGWTRANVDYTTCDGRLLMFVDRPLGALKLKVEGKTVTVTTADRDVMIPIRVDGVGPKPFYAVVKDGAWSRDFASVAGGVLRVTNLADGKSAVAGR